MSSKVNIQTADVYCLYGKVKIVDWWTTQNLESAVKTAGEITRELWKWVIV